MRKTILLGLLAVMSAFLGGCRRQTPPGPAPTPTPVGQTESVRFTVTYDRLLTSMIDAYLEAQILEMGGPDTALGTTTDEGVTHTKGLVNEQNYRISATPVDPDKAYVLRVNVYNNDSKSVLLYRGTCPTSPDCKVITLNNPDNVEIALQPATDIETIYNNSVPQNLRQQCAVPPDTTECDRSANRIYYDPNANTCKRFSWGGCGTVEPFTNITLCQQACIR